VVIFAIQDVIAAIFAIVERAKQERGC